MPVMHTCPWRITGRIPRRQERIADVLAYNPLIEPNSCRCKPYSTHFPVLRTNLGKRLSRQRLWHGPDRLEERQFAGGAEKLRHARLVPISIRAFKLHRHEVLPVNPGFIEQD